MDKNYFGGIVSHIEKITDGIFRSFNVLQSITGEGDVYSIYAVTEHDGERDECYVYDVARDEPSAVIICKFLAEHDVSAVHLLDVLSDITGIECDCEITI